MITIRKDRLIGFSIAGVLVVAIAASYATSYFASAREEKEWQKFSEEHNCKVVLRIQPNWKRSNGTGYLCDDGVEYWRSK